MSAAEPCDNSSNANQASANNYVPVHARRSPANIHALLSPNDDTYRKFNAPDEPLNREPFDLELLERFPDFVRRHLMNYHPLLHPGCAFMKRLVTMTEGTEEEEKRKSWVLLPEEQPEQIRGQLGSPWTTADYLRSATEAEQRSQRTPWGDVLPDAKPIQPNRLIDIEIRNAARGAAISYKNSPEGRKVLANAAKKAAAAEKAAAVPTASVGNGTTAAPKVLDPSEGATSVAPSASDVGAASGLASASNYGAVAMESIPKERGGTSGGEPSEEGEICETDEHGRKVKTSTTAAAVTPPPPVQQNPVPRLMLRRSPDGAAPARPRNHAFPPIFMMTSSGRPQFSTPSMVQAIRFFSPYLTPLPRDEDLSTNFVDYHRYSIRQDKVWSFIDNILQNSSVLSLEAMLLSANCFGRDSTEMAFKCLLTKTNKGKAKADVISPLQTLFVIWPDHVLQMADQTCRCSTAPGTGRMQGQQLPVDNSKRPEVMTAVAIINLVRRFGDCIRTSEQLGELKTEFGVDWYELCGRSVGIAKRYNLDSLSRACFYARAQLDNIQTVQGYAADSLVEQLTADANLGESAPNSGAKYSDSLVQRSHQGRDQPQPQQPQPQLAMSPMDHPAPNRVSALDLPELEKRDWMLKPPKYHPCKFFQRLNFCKNGPDCRYAHVYRPPHPLPNEVPTESLLHLLYSERNISLTTRDLVVMSAPGNDEKLWFTAALRCPIDQTIYNATGGVNGHLSIQGVYFYPTAREAIAAVAGIAVLAMANEEEIREYGLLAFPSTYMHSEPPPPPPLPPPPQQQQEQHACRQAPPVAEATSYAQPSHQTGKSAELAHAPSPSRQTSHASSFSFSELVPPSERVRQQQSSVSAGGSEAAPIDNATSFEKDALFAVQILEPAREKRVEPAEAYPYPLPEERKKPASVSTSEEKKQAGESPATNAAVAKWTSIPRKAETMPRSSAKVASAEKRSPVEAPQIGSRITLEDAELLNSPLLEKIRQAQDSQQGDGYSKTTATSVPALADQTAKNLWPEASASEAKAQRVAAATAAAALEEANSAIDERTKAEAVKAAMKEKAKAEKAKTKAAKAAAKAQAQREAEEKKRLDMEKRRLKNETKAKAEAEAASIAAATKSSAAKKAKAKAEKSKVAKPPQKQRAAAAASAIHRPPEIERRKPRQTLFSKLPPRRLEYHRLKSAKRPSSGIPISSTAVAGENSSETGHMEIIPYWDTLGSCRLDSSVFHWTNPNNGSANPSPNPFGYDKKLGRAYYSSFVLHGKKFNVGDYIIRTEYDGEDILRIVGAFQATKSFLGRWGGGNDWEKQKASEEIQKRGHPYILTAPLVTKASLAKAKPGRKRKAAETDEEIVISTEHGSSIFPLPQWLGEAQDGGYRKIRVHVSCTGLNGMETDYVVGDDAIEGSAKAPKKGKKGGRGKKKSQFGDSFVCKDAVVPEASTTVGLNSHQFELLTASPDTLLNSHIADLWDSRFKATQVQMITRDRSMDEDLFSEGKMVQFQYTGQSSDDSDSFDDEESAAEESDMD